MPLDLTSHQRDFAKAVDAPATGAMAVYRNTILHGKVEALRSNYPVVGQLLGADMFQAVAVDFAIECPPRTPVLTLYGARFADWLDTQPWIADLPYLSDVARVERLRLECLMAADAESLSADEVRAALAAPRELRLHPSVRFDWLRTPGMTIWLAHQRTIGSHIAPDWRAEGVLFVRPTPFTVHAPRVGPAAHRILSGLRISEGCDAALAAAEKLYPDEHCASVFASLVNLGLFAAPATERIA